MKFEPHPIYVKSIMLVSVLNLELYLDIDRTCVYVIITLDTPMLWYFDSFYGCHEGSSGAMITDNIKSKP